MKFFIALLALAVIAGAEESVSILRHSKISGPEGYNHFFESSNGIKVQEAAVRKIVGNEQVLTVQGKFEYTAPDGKSYTVSYTADETGFHPQGEHLP